ncbi:hypothetical protein AGMMS50262_01140 [Bacteroidia bacterium]|nr:hypothetical protein AGMMS50262_01140 [Bacteroidia bacterium]
MISKLKTFFLFASALSVPIFSNAQQEFYSQQLQNLYYSLPDECRGVACNVPAKTDTLVLCLNVVQGDTVPLIFRWDDNGVLEHAGYRFLSDGTDFNSAIVQFVERELLAALLSSNVNQTLITYRENGLSVLLNDNSVKQSFWQNKPRLLNLLKSCTGIVINQDGLRYDVTLLCADGQKLSFQFKADSELITGMDKKERDFRLAFQLKNHCATKKGSVATPDYSYFRLLRDSIYVDKGSEFIIPQINNDLFYIREDSIYTLARDTSFVAESFSNTMLVPDAHNCIIKIMHRMYGNAVKKYTVDSRDFYDYFARDCERYFGVETIGYAEAGRAQSLLTGTLILRDRNASSIHLAYITVSLDNLLNGGTMEMQLYSNIPFHNLQSLFGKQ